MSNSEGYPDPTADTAIANVLRSQRAKKNNKPIQENGKKEVEMKLKRVTRIDSIPAESTYFNEQGFLHDSPIVTSTGIFEYALPEGGVRRELRLPEHVFDKESLASYSGKPVIITHEAGSIDKTNVMDEIVGTILSEGYQDGDNVRCKIVIHDIDNVKKIPYRELSLGYSLDLIEEPGEYNGEHYDAIQTNIRINHLAIVKNARAGEQAHLNLDGKKVELSDKENLEEGGNKEMHGDNIDITAEELIEAIKSFKEARAAKSAEGTEPVAEPKVQDATPTEPVEPVVEPTEPVAEPVAEPVVEPVAEPQPEPTEPEVKEAEKKDSNIDALIKAVEELLAAIKATQSGAEPTEPVANDDGEGCNPIAEGEANDDSSDDQSQSMNNDSADDIVSQRLSICRIGDKVRLDGLENMSIIEGKKAIIAKVFPTMRMDGKTDEYIDAAYDLAVSEVDKRKDVAYQKQQMTANPTQRMDSNENVSMAQSARQRMIEREGGNE